MPSALTNTRSSGRRKGSKCRKSDSLSASCFIERLRALGGLPFQTKEAYNGDEVVKMRWLIALVIPAILRAGLVLLRLSDADIVVADIDTRDNQITANQSETSNSSASVTIATTMKGIRSE